MNNLRWGGLIIGLILFLISVWQILSSVSGVEVTTAHSTTPPMTFMSPVNGDSQSRPLILIAHGFAGSRVIMYGFALTFAHAGYNVALWDFEGHGANSESMLLDTRQESLIGDAEAVLVRVIDQELIDHTQVAILGHSMGSGVALNFGVQHPETAATIAVSPVNRSVTEALPKNLLVMAGSQEAAFLNTAEDLLVEAGGTGGDLRDGTARQLVVIPGVEHVSILFAPRTHHTARDWIDATFGEQPDAVSYTDRRILWYGLGLVGAWMVLMGLSPLLVEPQLKNQPSTPLWRRVAALVAGVIGATLMLWVLNLLGMQLHTLLGLLVGGFVLVWLGLTGMISWLVLWLKPAGVTKRKTFAGLVVFAVLWMSVGLLGQLVWLQWVLIPQRLVLWVLGVVLLLPLLMAIAEVMHTSGFVGRAAWWLVYSLILVGGLVGVMFLFPGMGFLGIILPLLPVVLAIHALAAGAYRSRWSFAISGALFISWVIVAVFPLV